MKSIPTPRTSPVRVSKKQVSHVSRFRSCRVSSHGMAYAMKNATKKSKYQSYLRINTLLTDATHENGNVVLILCFHD